MNPKVFVAHACLILVSFTLGRFVNPFWLWLGVFMGIDILQSAFTGFDPLEKVVRVRRRASKEDVDSSED